MINEDRNKVISAASTTVVLALLLVFLLLCGFTYEVPAPPPENEMVVEVQPVELLESGGGDGRDGGNFDPYKKDPSPEIDGKNMEVPATRDKSAGSSQESAPNAVTSPTGAKATVNETSHGGGTSTAPQQKVNQNALFPGGASTKGGNTSGNGGSTGHGDGLGLSNDIGYGGGHDGGTGRGWVKKPKIPKVAVDKDEKLYLDFDVDENGNLTNIRLSTKYPSTTQNQTLINQCIEELKTAKFQPGTRTNGTYLFKL